MISEKVQTAINDQINAEIHSAYLYLSMVSYFKSLNLDGFAQWMTVQTQEEISHAMKFFNFVVERGGRALLQPIAGPDVEWESPLAAFEAAYKHEQFITGRIDDLVQLARQEKDTASEIMLQWFVTEQVEEEANADGVIQKLKMMAGAPGGMFMLDRELGARVFTPPAAGV
jgi:ferritin